MPIYTYACECGRSKQKLLSKKADTIPCECGKEMQFRMPSTVESVTYEKKDPYRNVQLPKNHTQNMKKRFNDHHDKYEISKKIDDFGMDDAHRHGWIKKEKL